MLKTFHLDQAVQGRDPCKCVGREAVLTASTARESPSRVVRSPLLFVSLILSSPLLSAAEEIDEVGSQANSTTVFKAEVGLTFALYIKVADALSLAACLLDLRMSSKTFLSTSIGAGGAGAGGADEEEEEEEGPG